MRSVLLLLAALALVACASAGPTDRRTIHAKGAYQHRGAGVSFPSKLGVLERSIIQEYSGDPGNLGAFYAAPEKLDPVQLQLYIWPAGQAWAGRLRLQFVQRMAALRRGRTRVELRGAALVRAPGGTGRAVGYEASFRSGTGEAELRTLLRVFQCGQWFFRIQVTVREKDAGLLPLALGEAHGAISCEDIAARHPAGDAVELSIEPAVSDWPEWVAYGRGQVEWLRDRVSGATLTVGIPDYDLDLFVAAWNRALDARQAQLAAGTARPSALFDGLEKVRQAGFLDEYLWTELFPFLSPPDYLDLPAFQSWRSHAALPPFEARAGAVLVRTPAGRNR